MMRSTYESPVVEHGLRRVIISIAVITATLLEIIDVTIVNVSLPNIQGNFGIGVDLGAWIVTAYLIANVVVIPLNPWFAARFGRRQYFFGSIVIFTIASLMCGLSNSFGQLVFWRLIQGLGGGGLISTSQAILRDTYGIKEQGKAQGVFAMGVIVGPALGPVIGGWITDNWNWHWIFFINIPVGIIAATLIWNFLRNPAEPQYRKLDWVGLILLCIGLGSMQFVLENGQQYDWYDDARIRWFTFFSLAGLASFVWWTLRSSDSRRGSACLAPAASCGRQRAGRRARRQPLRLDHHFAAVSHQLARVYGDALGCDRHDSCGGRYALYAVHRHHDAARPYRSAALGGDRLRFAGGLELDACQHHDAAVGFSRADPPSDRQRDRALADLRAALGCRHRKRAG